ncbi:histidine phosphatase family protein, partial [Oceanivirga salmonicida]
KLKDAYTRIEELLDLEKGTIVNKKSNIYLDDTGYLHVKGALRLATDISDLFILKYYENFPLDKIFKSDDFMKDLRLISTVKDEFLDLIFGDTKYIKESKENAYLLLSDEIKKDNDLTLIVGHDSNLSCIMSMLDIDYKLNENMIEKYPIGAKLLFNIFEDDTYELYYVYYNYNDIREIKYNKPIMEKIKKGKLPI